jgi:hypothetical protein
MRVLPKLPAKSGTNQKLLLIAHLNAMSGTLLEYGGITEGSKPIARKNEGAKHLYNRSGRWGKDEVQWRYP